MTEFDLAIRLDDVGRVFDLANGVEPVRALDGVSLELARGETTVVIGPSGSGKTTLLNIVAGLDRSTTGQSLVLGQPLDELSEDQAAAWRRANVASIFQAKGLVPHLTAAENIDLALRLSASPRPERASAVSDALDAVGLDTFRDHLPRELSGGQQQRVAIARALVTQAPLLVADEPTGELDTTTAADMIELIVARVRTTGATALVATHDAGFRDAADHVIEIVDGRLRNDLGGPV